MKQKHYIDIQNFQTKYAEGFNPGDIIQITEKVDGSNTCLCLSDDKTFIQAFSRKNILNPDMTLNGLYEFAMNMDVSKFLPYDGYRIFGEWHIKHKIQYEAENIDKFWAFDVWNEPEQKWMPQEFVKQMAKDLGLNYVPELYWGPFISWDHINSFMEKQSKLGPNEAEGIVIKNQSNLNNPDNRKPFVVKLVNVAYQEKSKTKVKKPMDPDELAKLEYAENLTRTIVTENRVEKCLYKMITEDNLVPSDWDATDIPIIAKNLPSAVYHDCVKEEEETVNQVENFGKWCNKITMEHVRNLLRKQ